MLPRSVPDASGSARRAARSHGASDAYVSKPDPNSVSPRTINKTRGRSSLSFQLWMLLCGCGLVYLVMIWNAGWWTATTPATIKTMRAVPASTTPSPVAATALHQVHAEAIHAPAPIEAAPARRQTVESTASPSVAVQPPTAEPTASAASTPHPSTTPTTAPTHPPPSPSTPTETSTPPSTNFQNGMDAAWFQSPVATVPPTLPPTGPPRVVTLEEHTARMTELEEQRLKAISAIGVLKNQLHKVREQLQVHAVVIAEEDAKLVEELPANYKKQTHQRKFRCLGWRATARCDPNGNRKPELDRSCQAPVLPRMSGYCEVEDVVTKERFKVMKISCDTLRHDASLRCLDAWFFPNFAVQSHEVLRNATADAASTPTTPATLAVAASSTSPPTQGIVMVVYPKMLASIYATIRRLRSIDCQLTVEMWYLPSEITHPTADPILHKMTESYGPITLRAINDDAVKGYITKIHAIRHSEFDHVLFLDADNVPVKDPSYLFTLAEFTTTGALFWPDFWHPTHTIFTLHERSLVWEYMDLPFVDMFEQESGQIVIDRTRTRVAMELLHFYASHQPNLFDKLKIAHGDKDLFRFAWLKSNTSFHMVQSPPAIAGNLRGGMFCGQTMVQYDPRGEMLFLHRNAKKLEGRHMEAVKKKQLVDGQVSITVEKEEVVDPAIWTHLLQLKPTSSVANFTVEIYEGSVAFPRGQWCYGKRTPDAPHFNTFRFADLPVRDVENEIRAYALEATDLLRGLGLETK